MHEAPVATDISSRSLTRRSGGMVCSQGLGLSRASSLESGRAGRSTTAVESPHGGSEVTCLTTSISAAQSSGISGISTVACRCRAETIKRGSTSGRTAACPACSSSRAAGRGGVTLSIPVCRRASQMDAGGRPAIPFRGGGGLLVSGFLMLSREQSLPFSGVAVSTSRGPMRLQAVSPCFTSRSGGPSGRSFNSAVSASICGRASRGSYSAACISGAVSGRARPSVTITADATSSAMLLHAQNYGSSITARICAAFSPCIISGRSSNRPRDAGAIIVGAAIDAFPHTAVRGSLEKSTTNMEYVLK